MTPIPRYSTTIALILLCEGCFSVTTDITTIAQLHYYQSVTRNDIRLLTVDSSVYELWDFVLRDSVLDGSGIRITETNRSPFSGQLPLSSIVYIQGRKTSFGRSLLNTAMIGFVGVCVMAASEHHGLNVFRPTAGSCPYVYAWDGSGYVLQGEVFGTSFGKALETTTACMLPAVSPRGGVVPVRVSNERPETHYIDAIRAYAFEAPESATVLLDNNHRAWPVLQPQPPLRSPAAELDKRDGVYWTSDLGNTYPGGNNRDVVELTFPSVRDGAGSLVIHALNTELVNAVYDMVFGFLGDESLRFLYQVENDSDCIRTLRDWIAECSLSIDVWREGRWVCEGSIAPEANAAPFSRVVRISSEGVTEDFVRVRLSSLADMWKLDAVALDWTPVEPLKPHPLAMRRARQSEGGSVSRALGARDGDYTVLLPGESIELEFQKHRQSHGTTVAYALEATGYLYEWPLEDRVPRHPVYEPVAYEAGRHDRVSVVNFLIRHKELFLPLVYERWRDIRSLAQY